MPQAFDKCLFEGGKIRRVSGPSKKHGLKANEYVNYCYKDGKSYRGYTKKKHKKPKK